MSHSASKRSVLVLGSINFAQQSLKKLSDISAVTSHVLSTREAFLKACQASQPVAIYRPLDTLSSIGPFDAPLLRELPKSVKFIAHNGAGYDQIDVQECAKMGIAVSNTPKIVSAATADTAFWLILSTLRKFINPLKSCQEGQWRQRLSMGNEMGRDPTGKVVGIIGMGGIGQVLARRCQAFDMKVQYYNRNQLSEDEAGGVAYAGSLENLLKTSDVVSVNLPLNKATRHLLSDAEFAQMRDGTILINTARGPIIDEDAMVRALQSGKLGAVGLDVYEHEPKVHPGLLSSTKATLLPHIGTVSRETQESLEVLVLENIMSAITTDKLLTPVLA